MKLTVGRASALRGELHVPGDKSITHRALLLAGLGNGPSRISGYLDSGDCQATIGCLRMLGINVDAPAPGELLVQGAGLHGWREPGDVLDCIRSGTTMRLMAGLLAGQMFYTVLGAQAQLLRRPMDRVAIPLREMGARIWGRDDGRLPPLSIRGGSLRGIDYTLPMASAQVKSCVLLAGLYAQGQTIAREPGTSRDHTERMLRARGVSLRSEALVHSVDGPAQDLAALDSVVPGDFSSAAYWIVAALMVPESEIVIHNVGINPTRTGLLDVLNRMGAKIALHDRRDEGGEPVADLLVRTSDMVAADVGGDTVPRMIDEFPILALAATQAHGTTRIRDAAELRVKETDRIATTVAALRALGAHIDDRPDGFDVEGPTPLAGAVVDGAGDHRLAMTIAIAGLIAKGQTRVCGADCISDSYPGFRTTLSHVAASAFGGVER